MLRRTRILVNCLAALALLAAVFGLFWRYSFHCKTLIEGQAAYEPVFLFASQEGPGYREKARRLTKGRLEKVKYESNWLYYSEQAARLLKDKGYDNQGRTPYRYCKNEWGRLYVFDKGGLDPFEVFLLAQDDGPLEQFTLPKEAMFEGISQCGMDGEKIYLQRNTGDRVDIVCIDRRDGQTNKQSVKFDLLRSSDQQLYDPTRNRILFLNLYQSEKTLNSYSLGTGQLETIQLTKPASWILIGEQGYLLVNDLSARRIILYQYDWDLNPTGEIEIPLSDQGQRLGSWQDQHGSRDMALKDGIVYGGLKGDRAIWFYALDLENRQAVGLWEIRPPAGKLRLRSYRLFLSEE